MKGVDCREKLVPYIKNLRYTAILYKERQGSKSKYKFGFLSTTENGGAITTMTHSLYGREYAARRPSKIMSTSRFEKDSETLSKYFIEKEGIIFSRSKTAQTSMHHLTLSEKDNEIFRGTVFEDNFYHQHDFLMHLKGEIEERHRKKGEGFMSLLKKR